MQLTPEEQQVVDSLKDATNILVTVNSNPSVDQLAACLGLTIALNKADKHATAVFSGEVPSTLEFLKPEETLEKNTDSLRDFIISLDKSKADKLRYKVEDNVVKIFITPYRTAINESDFEYSQGDFNVQTVVALGVRSQQDLDEAIRAHGRILHDATVVSINLEPGSELGSVNITDTNASSLSEIVTVLLQNFSAELLDSQIATALLTGVVAETARFSNEKTTPKTMSVSSALMTAGANQQLVATKLDNPQADTSQLQDSTDPGANEEQPKPDAAPDTETPKEPGMLEIAHNDATTEEPEPEDTKPEVDQIDVDDEGLIKLRKQAPLPNQPEPLASDEPNDSTNNDRQLMPNAPTVEHSAFTANSSPEDENVSSDISLPAVAPASSMRGEAVLQPLPPEEPKADTLTPTIEPTAVAPEQPAKPFNLSEALAENNAADTPIDSAHLGVNADSAAQDKKTGETLAQLEEDIASPHLNDGPNVSDLDSARRAVEDAVAGLPEQPVPPQAFNAQPLVLEESAQENVAQSPPVLEPAFGQSQSAPAPLFDTATAPAEPVLSPLAMPAEQPLQMPQPTFAPPSPMPDLVPTPPALDAVPASPVGQTFMPDSQPPAALVSAPTAPAPQVFDPNAPPPVPPPMMPPGFGPSPQ
jgi:hypothetical protein